MFNSYQLSNKSNVDLINIALLFYIYLQHKTPNNFLSTIMTLSQIK